MKNVIRMAKQNSESIFIEKKSKFISYIAPVYTEQEAVDFVNAIKKKHYDASHNCSAFIVGETGDIQRSSDDGEPSGTAGLPILEVLRKESLTNTAIVVTRYFGGIMLGAGGLIRAYTQGCADAVKAAGIMRLQPYGLYEITIDYNMLSKMQYEMSKKEYLISNIQYLDIVILKMLVIPEQSQAFQEDIIQWTNANALIEYIGIETLKVDELTGKII
jgi:uncharacterized YigZ family protein